MQSQPPPWSKWPDHREIARRALADDETQAFPVIRPEEAETQQLPRYRPDLAPYHAAPHDLVRIPPPRPRVVCLVPVHNGADDLAPAIESLLAQTWALDEIIIISDNSTDDTVAVASRYPVTVVESEGNKHKKAGALNQAWRKYAQGAAYVVCIDDDTRLPEWAVEHLIAEIEEDSGIGGISTQPVMTGNDLLSRIQRAEFAESATLSLRRGWCRVISGTGCIFRNEALREASLIPGQEGPWTYKSVVEDYHLTFQMRKMGWLCIMSRDVYCLTGAMKTVRALWHQRIKWQSGTIGDLINFGFNRLNWREWMQQFFGIICMIFWFLWLTLNGAELARGHLRPNVFWLIYPLVFSVVESVHAWRIHGRDWKDMLIAATLVKALAYTWLSMAWIAWSWWVILKGSKKDLWNAQYKAEGVDGGEDDGIARALLEGDGSPEEQAVVR